MLGQSLRNIPHSWRLILISTLLAWTISLFISFNTVPTYRATATFLIYPNAQLTSSRDVVTSLDTLDKKTVSATYADIMNSTRVYSAALQKLNLNPGEWISFNRTTIVQENSNVLQLAVEGADPQKCTQLANTIGQTGIDTIKGIYQVFDITFLDQAVQPTAPIRPQPLRDGAVAAAAGLLAGLVLALLKEPLRAPLNALRERSIRDRGSGAYTQAYFQRQLETTLGRRPGDPLSLAIIELSGLQDLADGIPEGVLSEILHRVAEILHAQLRGNDLVGRWGRAGFALMLPATPQEPACRTLERICARLSEPQKFDGLDAPIGLDSHAGLACRTGAETALELARQAEEALQKSRSQGNNVACFEPERGE